MILNKNTPYMIRNDGKVFKCGVTHPYILHNVNNSLAENFRILFIQYPQRCKWFYNNTQYPEVKEKIINCLQYLANFLISQGTEYLKYKVTGLESIAYIEDILKDFDIVPEPFPEPIGESTIESLISRFEEINNLTNQEFLRCRTGGEYREDNTTDIYFRVSSAQFNWFDIIWQLVAENKNIIEFITIETDKQSGKKTPLRYYILNGMPTHHMGIDSFLTLKGNPIIEDYNTNKRIQLLREGKSLLEVFGDCGCFHNNATFEAYRDIYYHEFFTSIKKLQESIEKNNMLIYELLRKLGINKAGTYSDNDTYTIDLNDSNEYGRINSTLDRSEILDPIDESSYLTADNANLDYKYEDQFILSLIADFEEDYYQLVITEMKE